jgi:hypothetical protein
MAMPRARRAYTGVSSVEKKRRNCHGNSLVGPQLQHAPLVTASDDVLVDATHPRRDALDVVVSVLRFFLGDPEESLKRTLNDAQPAQDVVQVSQRKRVGRTNQRKRRLSPIRRRAQCSMPVIVRWMDRGQECRVARGLSKFGC